MTNPRARWRAAAILAVLFLSVVIGLLIGLTPRPELSHMPDPSSSPLSHSDATGPLLSPERSEGGTEGGPTHPTYAALPAVYRCACDTPTPPPDPLIFDCSALVTTTHWLTSTFGPVTWTQGDAATLSALHACCTDCPAVLVAHVEDDLGHPVPGVTVVMHWPDAPPLPPDLQNCGLTRGVYGPTNSQGDIGFGLGGGAYYTPPAAGPHTIWTPGGVCLRGLGMLAATNHAHLDSGWLIDPGPYADAVALRDWGYTPGTLVYTETVNGREMQVIRWPHSERTPTHAP